MNYNSYLLVAVAVLSIPTQTIFSAPPECGFLPVVPGCFSHDDMNVDYEVPKNNFVAPVASTRKVKSAVSNPLAPRVRGSMGLPRSGRLHSERVLRKRTNSLKKGDDPELSLLELNRRLTRCNLATGPVGGSRAIRSCDPTELEKVSLSSSHSSGSEATMEEVASSASVSGEEGDACLLLASAGSAAFQVVVPQPRRPAAEDVQRICVRVADMGLDKVQPMEEV